ncbi:PREDICTED: nuclear receptor subfamily 0 group B member 2-like [Nanorana parkeri]|uniref:nuclear receptor subfamily 0 group B member 2-like n=1 Tax=Nanorana parkeri TaxID=125878 RepID=UPI000854A34E|nr:PREDICTED: nuclear receptor subfamily 0 group B member 2-like [Nanorana parkeri]
MLPQCSWGCRLDVFDAADGKVCNPVQRRPHSTTRAPREDRTPAPLACTVMLAGRLPVFSGWRGRIYSTAMACKSERPSACQCNKDPVNSILFRMLNSEVTSKPNSQQEYHQYSCNSTGGCSCEGNKKVSQCPCEGNRKVVLKNSEDICKKASEVLLKTVAFIRNVPSFYQLPQEDQILLIHKCWAPLFVLGLAQERVDFEWKELSVPSLLKKILLNQSSSAGDTTARSDAGVAFRDVQRIQMLLHKLWSLDICTKEYAYLKGMVLFNPGISGMRYPHYVQTLHLEALQTLMEFTSMIHSRSYSRFTWMLEAVDFVKTIDSKVITELFFRPIYGQINLEEVLLETLFIKH